jgi:hypothetical protein
MLDKYIIEQAEYFERLYREIETNILVELAKMLSNNAITSTMIYELNRLKDLNLLDRNVIEQLSEITGKPMYEIIQTMEKIGFDSIDFPLYRKAYNENILFNSIDDLDLQPYISRTTDTTFKLIKSVETKARENTFKAFREVLDKTLIQTNAGLITHNQGMISAVKELNKIGVRSATYMSKNKEIHHQLESVMKRVIRTEFIKVSNDVSHEVGIDLGVETWYITQHFGARDKVVNDEYENHAKWQGTVVTTKELYDIAGYGEMLGLGGINCRHRHYAYIEGLSVKPPKQLNQEENSRIYALTQKQRRLEREIRYAKREVLMLEQFEQSIDDVAQATKDAKKVVRLRQATMRKFIDDNSDVLRRNYQNEKVVNINN